jgi:hypothetical protein
VNGHRTPETDRCSLLETIEFSVVTFTSIQTLIVVFFVLLVNAKINLAITMTRSNKTCIYLM